MFLTIGRKRVSVQSSKRAKRKISQLQTSQPHPNTSEVNGSNYPEYAYGQKGRTERCLGVVSMEGGMEEVSMEEEVRLDQPVSLLE